MPFYIVILANFKITVIRRSSIHKVHEFVVQGTYEAILEWQIFPQITLKFTIQLCSKVGCEFFQGVIYYLPNCGVWCSRELTTKHLTKPSLRQDQQLWNCLGLRPIPSFSTVKILPIYPSSSIDSWSLVPNRKYQVACIMY